MAESMCGIAKQTLFIWSAEAKLSLIRCCVSLTLTVVSLFCLDRALHACGCFHISRIIGVYRGRIYACMARDGQYHQWNGCVLVTNSVTYELVQCGSRLLDDDPASMY